MEMKKIITLALASMSLLLASHSFASTTQPHTWHTVSTTSGTWNAKLRMINEGGSFVNRSGSSMNDFTVDANTPAEYGFTFDQGDDFDVAYTLTLTAKPSTTAFVSKTCVYVVTAKGPANPDIQATGYNGAKCDWKTIQGVGENFTVS